MNKLSKISIALLTALAAVSFVGAQQSGSGIPGGSVNSTQIKLTATGFGGVGPGTSGHVLTSNGAGSAPSFQAAAGGSPGGANTNVQYNASSAFGGESTFAYNATSNQLLMGDGTLTLPAYSFVNDTDLGIWRAGANNMLLGHQGFEYVNINGNAAALTLGNTSVNTNVNGATFNVLLGGGANELVISTSSITAGQTLNTVASTTSVAGLNVPAGTAPSSPVNGDVWTTTAGMFARINGSTVGPFAAGGGGGVTQTNGTATATFTAGCSSFTLDFTWVKTGDVATLTFTQDVTCTSSGAVDWISTTAIIPAGIRPARNTRFPMLKTSDAGTAFNGCVLFTATGFIVFSKMAVSGSSALACGSTFAAAGTRTISFLQANSPFDANVNQFTYALL